MTEKGKIEKICLDNDCQEAWIEVQDKLSDLLKDFVYCPYCSEELHIQCSVCRESLSNKDYRFCPWCGAEFSE